MLKTNTPLVLVECCTICTDTVVGGIEARLTNSKYIYIYIGVTVFNDSVLKHANAYGSTDLELNSIVFRGRRTKYKQHEKF